MGMKEEMQSSFSECPAMDHIGSHPLQELKECNFTSNLSVPQTQFVSVFLLHHLPIPSVPPPSPLPSFLPSFPPSFPLSFLPSFLTSLSSEF